jgi:tyrosyl-tRNA synthetase
LDAEKIAGLVNPDKTHPKEAKVLLGKSIVADFYDQAAAKAAAAHFKKVFAQKQLPDEIPEVVVPGATCSTTKILVQTVLVPSSSQAKRMIRQGAVTIDGNKITDPNAEITPTTGMTLQVGKRKFAKLKVKQN